MEQAPEDDTELRRRLALITTSVMQYIVLGVATYAAPHYCKQPLHDSSLQGRAWLDELLCGHPDKMRINFGMQKYVFLALVVQIRLLGYVENQQTQIYLDESLAIFLYTCVTGLSVDHVAERFQHSKSTIAEHFTKMAGILSSPAFYNRFVHLPDADDPVPDEIRLNPKLWPFFSHVLGAIDGTHINCTPSAEDIHNARNRKGGITMNCLAVVDFRMCFLLFISGWDGCAADSQMYATARLADFPIPAGKCYLADAGFGICDNLLVPYRGVRYHLAEWGRVGQRPVNAKELYNLRHASARNVVERIFGVVKSRWAILSYPPHYSMEIQAQIPVALVALHNFIMEHDAMDIERFLREDVTDDLPGFRRDEEVDFGRLKTSEKTSRVEKQRAESARDVIANQMWAQYSHVLADRAAAAMDIDDEFIQRGIEPLD